MCKGGQLIGCPRLRIGLHNVSGRTFDVIHDSESPHGSIIAIILGLSPKCEWSPCAQASVFFCGSIFV